MSERLGSTSLAPDDWYQISRAVLLSNFASLSRAFGDDLIQEGVLGIVRGFQFYRADIASEATFAARLARNAMIDSLRKLLRHDANEFTVGPGVVLPEPAFEDDVSAADASEAWAMVSKAFADDPRLRYWREIVAGRLQGLADSEIARAVGVSKATISREAARLAANASFALGLRQLSAEA